MADRIHRVTMFKLPKPQDVEAMLEQYKILQANNKKVRANLYLRKVATRYLVLRVLRYIH